MTRDLGTLLGASSATFGTWTRIAAPEMVDLIGLNGFQFTIIDCQHGPFGIETAEEAAQAVAATRFGPEGLRGACPCCRSGGHFIRNRQDYAAAEEARTGANALVETARGHSNIAEICATPGLTALMAGASDLSVSMGLQGDWRHAAVQTAPRPRSSPPICRSSCPSSRRPRANAER